MEKQKRIVSLLLSVLMLIGMFPQFTIPTLAAEDAITKVTGVADVVTGTGEQITMTTASKFYIGNTYEGGKSKVYIEVSGVTGNKLYAYVNGSESSIYMNSDTGSDVKYITIDESEVGDKSYSVVIKTPSYEDVQVEYAPVVLNTTVAQYDHTAADLITEPEDVNIGNYYVSSNIYLPMTYVHSEDNSAKLYNKDGELFGVQAKRNKINSYDNTIKDPAYDGIFSKERVDVKVKGGNVHLELGKLLTEGLYDIHIVDSNDNVLQVIPNAVNATAKPVVRASSYPTGYKRMEIGAKEFYTSAWIYGDDEEGYSMEVYDSKGALVAKSVESKIDNKYQDQADVIYKMSVLPGKSLVAGEHTVKVVPPTGVTVAGEITANMTIYDNNNNQKNVLRTVIPDYRYANFVVFTTGFDDEAIYKLESTINNVKSVVFAKPTGGVFDVEFQDAMGKVLPIMYGKHYDMRIYEQSQYGTDGWQNTSSTNASNYYVNANVSKGINYEYEGNAYLGNDNKISGWFNENKANTTKLSESTVFKIVLTSVTGEVYELDNLKHFVKDYELYKRWDMEGVYAPANMPYGCYYMEIFADGKPILEKGINIFMKNDNTMQYRKENKGTSWRTKLIDESIGHGLVYGIQVRGLPGKQNVTIDFYKSDNLTLAPSMTVTPTYLKAENGTETYQFNAGNTAGFDIYDMYEDVIIKVDGKPYESMSNRAAYGYLDSTTFGRKCTIAVSQSANGTLSIDKDSDISGQYVYVTAIPNEGYQLKPNSIRVNGKPIVGRGFMLSENCVVTAQFEEAKLMYTAKAGRNDNYARIFIDKTSYIPGETVTVTVVPKGRYIIKGLGYGTNEYGSFTDTIDITGLETDKVFTATFKMPEKNIFIGASDYENGDYNLYKNISPFSTEHFEVKRYPSQLAQNENNVLPGETMYIVTNPDIKGGTRIKDGSLKVNDVAVVGNIFVMPDVDANVTFETETVNVASIKNYFPQIDPANTVKTHKAYAYRTIGGVELELTLACEGETVEVKTLPYKGFKLKEGSLGYKIGESGTFAPITGTSFAVPKITNGDEIIIVAEFVPEVATVSYDVTFSSNGGTGTMSAQAFEENIAQNLKANSFTRTGFAFDGWNTKADGSGTKYANGASFTATADTTLYATWKEVSTYSVTFNSNGGTSVSQITGLEAGAKIEAPVAPTKEGFTFVGWYKDSEFKNTWDFAKDTVNGNVTLFAKWSTQAFKVAFNSNGGSAVNEINVEYNGTVVKPVDPEKAGFTFAGWYKDVALKTPWDFASDKVTMDVTLYASWDVKQLEVKFNTNGGNEVPSSKVDYGAKITKPLDPVKAGYTFAGWYKDVALTTPWDFEKDTVEAETTVYAKWSNLYTVTFHSMGGSAVDMVKDLADGAKIVKPSDPTRAGFDFAGWFKDVTLKTPWNFDTDTVTANVTLYAKWEGVGYTITVADSVKDAITVAQTAKVNEKVTVSVKDDAAVTTLTLEYKLGEYERKIALNTSGDTTFVMPAANVEITGDVVVPKDVEITVTGKIPTEEWKATYYSYDSSYTKTVTAPKGGKATITGVPKENGMVYISLGQGDGYAYRYNQLAPSETAVTFDLPHIYNVSGKISGVATYDYIDIQVIDVASNKVVKTVYSNESSYKIPNLLNGSYKLAINGGEYSLEAPVAFTVNGADVTADIVIKTNTEIVADIKAPALASASEKISVYLVKKATPDNVYIANATCQAGQNLFPDASFKEAGDYIMWIENVRDNSSWRYKDIVSAPVEFTITEDDLSKPRYMVELSYDYKVDPGSPLNGDGNLVTTDTSVIKEGENLVLDIRYKNNNSIAVNGTFDIALPVGFKIATGETNKLTFEVKDLKQGESGRYKLALTVDGSDPAFVLEAPHKISVSFTENGTKHDFGVASVEGKAVTLYAPQSVKTGEEFIVYGEVNTSSEITIQNAKTGEVYASVKAAGKFYSAKVTLPSDGEIMLVAKSAGAQCKPIMITATSEPISIVNVKKNTINVSFNQKLGIYAFSEWVDMDLMGYPFDIATEFANDSGITEVKYHFSGNSYKAEKTGGMYTAKIDNWGGAGLKPLTATVVSNGKTYEFVVAEVTVLIDPSGVITNSVTGKPLEGATATCWILENGVWKKWDAENYGQVNPQLSDEQGKYGWMVPAGNYRITAEKAGFEVYDSLADTSFANNGNSTIIIPPPRDDVNFNMVPNTYMIGKSSVGDGDVTVNDTAKYTETVTVTATPKANSTVGEIKVTTASGALVPVTNNTFVMPNEDVNVAVTFIQGYTITATAGTNGTITPSGAIGVAKGDSKTFTITADSEYHISDVKIDGASVGPVSSYVFSNVQADHSITASFAKNSSGGGITGGGTGGTTESNITTNGNTTTVSAKVSGNNATADVKLSLVKDLASRGNKELVFSSSIGNITLDSAAIAKLAAGSGDVKITVSVTDATKLSSELQEKIGQHPVVNITVTAGGTTISDLNAVVEIPYTLKEGEKGENLCVVYINSAGRTEIIKVSGYNKDKKAVVVVVNNLSKLAITYQETSFNDVEQGAWYQGAVSFVAVKELFGGIGGGNFAPEQSMTRAMFVTVLARLANADLSVYTTSSFKDVDINEWYGKAVAWAADKGIVSGGGDGMYAPNAEITREQMAVMFNNYIVKMGIKLEKTQNRQSFADDADISDWAKEAVYTVKEYGLISGIGDNLFAPKATANRASVAQMFKNFIEISIK